MFRTKWYKHMPDGQTSLDSETAKALTELAHLPWFQVDGERNVVAVSPAMLELTGFTREQVMGRSCLNLHRCAECLAGCRVFEVGDVRDKALELYRADGSVAHVSKSGRVFRDEHGAITGALEVVRPLPGDNGQEPEEARRIRAALTEARYHRGRAARALGISRTTLWRKMKAYGLG